MPTRRVRKRVAVDTSKFMTPYLAHSMKMLEQYSHVRNLFTRHTKSLEDRCFHIERLGKSTIINSSHKRGFPLTQ